MAIGQIAKLVASLVEGGGLDKALMKKLERMGGNALLAQLGVGTGGALDLSVLTDLKLKPLSLRGFIASAQPGHMIKRLQRQFLQAGKKRGVKSRGKWSRSEWASSRDDWLGNQWKHDWRSQPRNALGKWIPGRLSTIEAHMQYKGKKAGRRTKRRRALRRAARLRGRKAAKMAFRR